MLKLGVSLTEQEQASSALLDWLLAIDEVIGEETERGRSDAAR